MQTALLSSTYFGPIQWYQKLFRYQRCIVEQHDNFIKQTYRNRCVISATQGVQALSIPVEPAPQTSVSGKVAMKDVRISDHGNWRHLHWNALTSAYGESPFFEYYEDDIRPFFEKQHRFVSFVKKKVEDRKIWQEAMLLAKHLIIRFWRELKVF